MIMGKDVCGMSNLQDERQPLKLVSIGSAPVSLQEQAATVREELRPLIEQVCAILNAARVRGLEVGFTCPQDVAGVFVAGPVIVKKVL